MEMFEDINIIFISKSFRTIVFVFFFFHNVSSAVPSSLPQVSPIYLGIEMIQTGKNDFQKTQKDRKYTEINYFQL